ncbi:MAG: DUF2589 domain-containing protein [bacterium]|nr:DUF2589 domain-containing protein [bacterium]
MSRETSDFMVSLGHLVGAPLLATIKADFLAAKRSARYIEHYGFEKGPGVPPSAADRELGRLKMVVFEYDQADPGGKRVRQRIKLPKLSLIPLPLLQVKDADFRFDIRVTPPPPEKVPTSYLPLDPEQEISDLTEPERFRWMGTLAPAAPLQEEKGAFSPYLQANMRFNIKAQQADLPEGILKLLNLMGNAETVESSPSLTTDKQRLILVRRQAERVVVTARRPDGLPDPGKTVALALFGEAANDVEVRVEGQPLRGCCFQVAENGQATLELSLKGPAEPPPGSALMRLMLEGPHCVTTDVGIRVEAFRGP